MTRVMLKDGANIYRVIVDRPGRPKTHPYPCPTYTEIYGPYGTQGAATGKLTHETKGYYGRGGTGRVQVVESPQWKDLA